MPVLRIIRAKRDTTVAQYIIHHPQAGRVAIPQTWTVPIPPGEAPAAMAKPPASPLDLPTLRHLAKLVQTLQAQQSEEANHVQTTTPLGPDAATSADGALAGVDPQSAATPGQVAGGTAAAIPPRPAAECQDNHHPGDKS